MTSRGAAGPGAAGRGAAGRGDATAPVAERARGAEQSHPAIAVADLRVAYARGAAAVDGIDLTVRAGELVSLVGASGAGKSSVVRALLGLLDARATVSAARLEIDGVDLRRARERDWRRVRGRRVAYVPQDPLAALNPNQRIGAQIAEAVVATRAGADAAAGDDVTESAPEAVPESVPEAVARLLRDAGITDLDVRHAYPHELSGGQRQRALIAISLAGSPRVLIADEPTSALDRVVRMRVLDRLRRLATDEGRAVLLVTHDLEAALDLSDRLAVLEAGRFVSVGTPVEIRRDDAAPRTRALVHAARALSMRDGDRRADAAGEPRDLVTFSGVSVVRARRGARGEVRPVTALDRVDLRVPAGRTVGVVGESGAGKTTLLRAGLGLVRPTHGSVGFDGTDLATCGRRELRALRRRFQLVQQDPAASLDPRFTVARSIAEPLRAHGVGDRRARDARVAELLDRVRLPASFARRRPRELSGGQRQRVALARALALAPELVYLDEPVSALDTEVQAEILDLLVELQDDLGVTYVFVSHDLGAVARIAHRIAVFREGKLVEQGATRDVLTAPVEPYTRTLVGAGGGEAEHADGVEHAGIEPAAAPTTPIARMTPFAPTTPAARTSPTAPTAPEE